MNYLKYGVSRYMLLILVAFIISLVAGCASTNPSPNRTESGTYKAIGMANFYGYDDGFEGTRMANGKIFHSNDPYLAAQQSLPLGTKVKVTDLKNNKSIYVTVTDRIGKAAGENIISLSYAASKLLGLQKASPIKVEVENSVAPIVGRKPHDRMVLVPMVM